MVRRRSQPQRPCFHGRPRADRGVTKTGAARRNRIAALAPVEPERLSHLAAKKEITMQFNERHTATILAALRYWQREGITSCGHEGSIACNGGDIAPLTVTEIDDLCERINFADGKPAEPSI